MILLLIIIGIKKGASSGIAQLHNFEIGFLKIVFALLIFNLFAIESKCQTQNAVFDIVRNDKKIGELHSQKICVANSTSIKVTATTYARFIFEVKIETEALSTFKDGHLLEVTSIKKVNGSEKINNHVTQNNNGYMMKNIDGDVVYTRDAIDLTTVAMYFDEPKNSGKMFSEMFLRYVPLTCITTGKYKVEMPDGSINYYYYTKGVLTKVEIHTTFFTANIILKSFSNNPSLASEK